MSHHGGRRGCRGSAPEGAGEGERPLGNLPQAGIPQGFGDSRDESSWESVGLG